ncbi:hypothetical protein BKA82DRAFT_4107941 [Pisolithus tinctorius]|nr:hypothetical protein BKA82DRAFT_4107941 [Pisolithus tinctorius]
MKRKLGEREQDVVEDSEPEREERRRQRREHHRNSTTSTVEQRPAVLVQCESTEEPSSLPGSLHCQIDQRSTTKLELKNTTGCRSSEEERNEFREPSVPNVGTLQQPTLNRNCPSLPLITTIEECHPEEHDEVDELSCMQLCQFAYQPLRHRVPSHDSSFPKRQPDSSSTPSRSHVETGRFPKQPSGEPAGAEISALSKCVCCGLQWTTKKTVKQKRTHIEMCARRHAISAVTLLSLVNKEVNVTPPHANERQISTGAHGQSATTLMGAIVSAEPGKRNKRKHVVSTVKTLPETRESILGKARDLLGQLVAPQKVNIDRSCTDSDEVQPTQQFGTSMLARRSGNAKDTPSRQGKVLQTQVMEAPPSTQAFGESALGGKRMTSRMLDAYYNPAMEIPGLP